MNYSDKRSIPEGTCLFVWRFNAPVNNVSVMSAWRHCFLGLTTPLGSYCVFLNDTTCCSVWGSIPGPLDLEIDALPLGHHIPEKGPVIKNTNEPSGEKTNNVVSEQVRHKSDCTITEDG